ncbi:putative gustatory receptor 58b [Anastrepha ludens]|uniref:putative gustatory receptor 58b n=1 Tax=Anastrepha ludens TaxID=28586 RepID=UPI0023B1FBF2|nr:putative gustatory receptor 58b [Anastrepha ludens]
MKLFEELSEVDSSVECSCDLLSQQLRQHKLRIRILGMIDLNKRLSFLIFGALVKNVLLLLQWDLGKQFDE